MVVKLHQTSRLLICQWFVGKKLEQGLFAIESLLLAEEELEIPKS